MSISRGDIYWAELDPTIGSEQAGRRPVLVIQNNVGNQFSPTTIIAPLTTAKLTRVYPTNVHLPRSTAVLKEESTILLSQIRTIDKARLGKKIGHLSDSFIEKVDEAAKVSLALA